MAWGSVDMVCSRVEGGGVCVGPGQSAALGRVVGRTTRPGRADAGRPRDSRDPPPEGAGSAGRARPRIAAGGDHAEIAGVGAIRGESAWDLYLGHQRRLRQGRGGLARRRLAGVGANSGIMFKGRAGVYCSPGSLMSLHLRLRGPVRTAILAGPVSAWVRVSGGAEEHRRQCYIILGGETMAN